jgi:hypothetical protein
MRAEVHQRPLALSSVAHLHTCLKTFFLDLRSFHVLPGISQLSIQLEQSLVLEKKSESFLQNSGREWLNSDLRNKRRNPAQWFDFVSHFA